MTHEKKFSNSQVVPQSFTLVEPVQEVAVLAAEVLEAELEVELEAELVVQEELEVKQVVVEDQAAVVAEEAEVVVGSAMEEVEMEVRNKISIK